MSQTHHYLQHERKRSHLTQEDIAFLSNTTDNTKFSKIESGIRSLDIEAIATYHFLFDIPLYQFLKQKRTIIKEHFLKKAPLLLKVIGQLERSPRNQRRYQHIQSLLARYTPHYEN